MAKYLHINLKKEKKMNKYIRSDEIKDNIPNSNPVIKISHFDNDKCIKTDIYPISHFLDRSSREIKTIVYS